MTEKQAIGLPSFLRRRLLNWSGKASGELLKDPSIGARLNELATGIIETTGKKLEPAVERHIPAMGKAVGQSMVEGIEQQAQPFIDANIKKLRSEASEYAKKIRKQAPEIAAKIIDRGTEQAGDIAGNVARNLSAAAGLGAAGGAAVSPEDRTRGALRGAAGGLIGGATGAAWGRLLPKPTIIPAAASAIIGGLAGGATTPRDERTFGDHGMTGSLIDKESSMEGCKLAGVTLDWYDDNGETLKQKFPTLNQVPEIIKQAEIRPKEKLANEDFALIMVDRGHVFRKFACADPGTTAMSVIYFMEHGDKLPEEAQKTAATNLMSACISHNLLPPVSLSKMAEPAFQPKPHDDSSTPVVKPGTKHLRMLSSDEEAQKISMAKVAVNVTGKRPKPIVKLAKPTNDSDYAVILEDGTRKYPIHTWDMVKKAEYYFLDNKARIQPDIRRQYAVKLAAKAQVMGYPLDQEIASLGSPTYADDGSLKDAIDMRKVACDPKSGSREFLDELFEKHASIRPEVYSECLRRFDINEGLDKGWDQIVPDPWTSTFGKAAAEVVWEDGADRVTKDALINLAENRLDLIVQKFTYQVGHEFRKDPIGIFNSMPDPQKKIIARMASDAESDGMSGESGTNK